MTKGLYKKGLVLAIIVCFVGAGVIPTTGGTIGKLSGRVYTEPIGVFNGDTIYVDDDSTPPGNGTIEWPYCRIQHAIENASKGDTIYVCNGTYYENVLINEEVALYGGYEDLIGDDVDGSVIDGGGTRDVVYVTADRVTISRFTIQNSGSDWLYAGIKLSSGHNTILDNNILNTYKYGIWSRHFGSNTVWHNRIQINSDGTGIRLDFSSNNNILANDIFSPNGNGIYLVCSDSNIITKNLIMAGLSGVELAGRNGGSHNNNISLNEISSGIFIHEFSSGNEIFGNSIFGCPIGVWLFQTNDNVISKNQIEWCTIGINVVLSTDNIITYNNLMSTLNVRLVQSLGNRWKENFWSDHPTTFPPRLIIGRWYIVYDLQLIPIRYPNFDWRPRAAPYEYPWT